MDVEVLDQNEQEFNLPINIINESVLSKNDSVESNEIDPNQVNINVMQYFEDMKDKKIGT